MLRKALILMLCLFFASLALAQDIPALLAQAKEFKYAEKYEAALKIYEQVLGQAPDNQIAQQGKADCELMLSPPIMIQHLAPIEIDEEYRELVKKYEAAKTPWDKRRADMELEMYAVRYTGKVFSRQEKKLLKQAEQIVDQAIFKAEFTGNSSMAYLEAKNKLSELQKHAHQSWKGHGPEVISKAKEKLERYINKQRLFGH